MAKRRVRLIAIEYAPEMSDDTRFIYRILDPLDPKNTNPAYLIEGKDDWPEMAILTHDLETGLWVKSDASVSGGLGPDSKLFTVGSCLSGSRGSAFPLADMKEIREIVGQW